MIWSLRVNTEQVRSPGVPTGKIWGEVFKNGPSKNLWKTAFKKSEVIGCLPQILLGPFLNILSHMFSKSAIKAVTSLHDVLVAVVLTLCGICLLIGNLVQYCF